MKLPNLILVFLIILLSMGLVFLIFNNSITGHAIKDREGLILINNSDDVDKQDSGDDVIVVNNEYNSGGDSDNDEDDDSSSGRGSDEQDNKDNSDEKTQEYFKINYKTSEWADFYGYINISGEPAEQGDEIGAYDNNGILCGVFVVDDKGQYGFLHVYGDDLTTSQDEGARQGQEINFKIYDWSEDKVIEYDNNITWNSFKTTRVDIIA